MSMKTHPLAGITRLGTGRRAGNPPPHSPVSMQNRVHVQVVGPDKRGRMVTKQDVDRIENVMLTQGLSSLVQMIGLGTNAASTWIQAVRIGTDNTAADSTQTGLLSGVGTATVGQADASGTCSRTTVGANARVLRYVATFESNNPAGTATIQEAGLFYGTDTNHGAARSVLAPIVSKGSADKINLTYDIQFNTGASTS